MIKYPFTCSCGNTFEKEFSDDHTITTIDEDNAMCEKCGKTGNSKVLDTSN
jgi:hypothetical protein